MLSVVASVLALYIVLRLVWPLRLRALHRALGLPVWAYLRQWLAPAAAGLLVFGVLTGLLAVLPTWEGTWPRVGVVLGGGVLAVGLYLAAGAVLFRGTLRELVGVLRGRRTS